MIDVFYYKSDKKSIELMKESLKCVYGEDISVCYGESGKPHTSRGFLSVTHTDGLTLVAISDKRIGIDCESKSRRVKRARELAKRFFSSDEQAQVLSGRDMNDELLKLWVKKEAYLKFYGNINILQADTARASGVFDFIEDDNYYICIYSEKADIITPHIAF